MGVLVHRRPCLAALSSVAIGQMLSAVNSGTNIFCDEAIRNRGLNVQIFPAQILYHILLLVSLLLLPISWKFFSRAPRNLIIAYGFLGFVDFGANVAVMKSFNYLASVSVMLVTSTSAIFAMFMAMVAFRRQYGHTHFLGASVVMFGLGFINASRYLDDNESKHNNNFWLGMVLAMAAAIGYALSNTLNEYVCRFEKGYPIGALAGMGLFGSLVSAVVCHLTQYGRDDRNSILGAPWQLQALLAGFVACMIVLYLAIPWFIQTYSAVQFNFHNLTADIFVLLYKWLVHGDSSLITPIYLTGFVLVLVGLAVFNMQEPIDKASSEPADNISLCGSVNVKSLL